MATINLTITYDGSDEEVFKVLGSTLASLTPSKKSDSTNSKITTASPQLFPRVKQPSLERIALKFVGYVSARRKQLAVMRAWLGGGGKARGSELVKAAGVKKPHDLGGVGGSLTKNMMKADGPRDWFDKYRDANGDWIYEITYALVQPLKEAFGVK
jgi:hypothetical protein